MPVNWDKVELLLHKAAHQTVHGDDFELLKQAFEEDPDRYKTLRSQIISQEREDFKRQFSKS